MPFDEVETITRDNAPPVATLSYLRPRSRGDKKPRTDRPPQFIIAIPTKICGTSKSQAFVLLIGKGDDAGKLRIKGDAKGKGVKPAQMKWMFRFNFGFVPRLGEDLFDGERRPIRKISDEEFEIDVPASWFEGEG